MEKILALTTKRLLPEQVYTKFNVIKGANNVESQLNVGNTNGFILILLSYAVWLIGTAIVFITGKGYWSMAFDDLSLLSPLMYFIGVMSTKNGADRMLLLLFFTMSMGFSILVVIDTLKFLSFGLFRYGAFQGMCFLVAQIGWLLSSICYASVGALAYQLAQGSIPLTPIPTEDGEEGAFEGSFILPKPKTEAATTREEQGSRAMAVAVAVEPIGTITAAV